ncbi:MAG: DNA-3-methyladenine glycosylase I [Bdellovibrionales bacterium]|jgi:DNA-3-methyladenine glycosylase I
MVDYCEMAKGHPLHGPYHDTEYGFPSRDERVLFERLALEIMQAGLSWEIVLKKRGALNKAFDGYRVATVAAYGEADIQRLLADEGIIRNRRKIEAIVANAAAVLNIRKEYGGFACWLDAFHPQPKADWVKLFKKTLQFTGGEITGEFLMSLGYLEGAHKPACPVYKKIKKAGGTRL